MAFDEFFTDEPDAPAEQPEPAPTDLVTLAGQQVIKTDADYETAADLCKQLVAEIKAAEKEMDPLIASAHATHKQLCDKKNDWIAPFKKAELFLRGAMTKFQTAEEEARKKAERELREAQEAEQRKLQAEADRIRREKENTERQAQAEVNRLAAEGKADEAAHAAEAAAAAATEREQAAQAIQDAAASMPMSAVSNSTPKVDGVSTYTDYEIVVEDDAKVPVEFMGRVIRPVDQGAIKKLVKEIPMARNIPGIKITEVVKPKIRT